MKIFIFSLFLVFSLVSVANSDFDSGFVLQKSTQSKSAISNNIVNFKLYSSGYESCMNECDADFDNDYNFYCSGGYYDTQVCEILEDELYACYDYCNY